jgi:hypothetical protein
MTSESVRAEVVETGNPSIKAGRITIAAPAQEIFDVLATPGRHADIDGSGTVERAVSGPARLSQGAQFGMAMRIKLPYRIKNTVVEFDEPRQIAWRHTGRHRWRYQLEPIDENTTVVTETFDGSTAIFPPALKLMNASENNQKAILKTLVQLKAIMESV